MLSTANSFVQAEAGWLSSLPGTFTETSSVGRLLRGFSVLIAQSALPSGDDDFLAIICKVPQRLFFFSIPRDE